jgi:methionyl-tRNA formyltransferase
MQLMNNLTFFLMSYKGYSALKSFISEFGTEAIDIVVTSKDPNVQNDYYEDIIELCKNNQVKFFDRRDKYELKSEYAYAISWRWFINSAKTTLIVFHDSLLPKYRGFAPLTTALINGENEVGVTAFYASAEYDKGNIIAQISVKIEYPIKINNAINLVSGCYIDLIKSITKDIISSKPVSSTIQDEDAATYSLWLDEKDYAINWAKDAEYIKRFIDSTGYPFKGAMTNIEDKKVRILDAEIIKDVNIPARHYGKVIFVNQEKPVVVCGKGLLQINEIIDKENQSLLPLKNFRTRFE